MQIDLSFISSKEEFVDYFIYFYEYTFVLDDYEVIDVKKELYNIIDNVKFDTYMELWVYSYLRMSLVIMKEYPLIYLKDTIKSLAKNFQNIDPTILEIQLELIKDVLSNLNVSSLEIRPYEQLKLNSPYGTFLLKYEKNLINFFEKYKENFSENLVNKCLYIKIKNQKYIDFPTLIFELYSVILFEIIQESLDNDFKLENIDYKIKNFLKSFKKGKFNNDLFEELKNKTIKYVLEYKQDYHS